MQLVNPWDNLAIRKIFNQETLQSFDNHIHVLYVLIGNATVQADDSYLVLQKDDFLIMSKASAYHISYSEAKIFQFDISYPFPMNTAKDDFEYIFTGDSVANTSVVDSEVITVLNQLLKLYILKEFKQNAFVFQNYFALIGLLEKNYRKKIPLDSVRNTKRKIEELKFYIDNNFEKDIRLSSLANQLFVSEQYLSRLFAKEIGTSLSEYVIRKRLEKVREELLGTEKSVTDIAFSAGFSNINSFNRLFKKYQGITPSAYRKAVKSEVRVVSEPLKDDSQDFDDLQQFFDLKKETPEESLQKISVNHEGADVFNSQFLINLGYAEDLLQAGYVRQMDKLENLDFTYGRVWGLLSEAVIPEADGGYDFSRADEILGRILEAGLIPFIELGFKGKVVFETHTSIVRLIPFELKSNVLEDIVARYQAFLRHCITFFGFQEVSSWCFELWKPNQMVLETIGAGALGKIEVKGQLMDITKEANYLKFFSAVATGLKQIIPGLKVGGCEMSLDIEKENLEGFIKSWQKEAVQPDFFSVSIYSMDEIKSELKNNRRQNPISPNTRYMLSKLKDVRDVMKRARWQVPIFVTEFNVTILNRDVVNDTAFKGPFIVKNVLEIMPYCEVIGYWLFTDFSAVARDTQGRELFGGAGLLSRSGLPKIGYFAFEFLKKMAGQVLYTGKEMLATKDGDENVHILISSYNHLNATYYYNSEGTFDRKNIHAIFDNKSRQSQKILLTDLPAEVKKFHVTTHRIGEKNGNLMEEMNLLSESDQMTGELIQYLRHRGIPSILSEIRTSRRRQIELSLTVDPCDLIYIELRPMNE